MTDCEPAPAASAASIYEQEVRIPESLYVTGKGYEAEDIELRYGELASIAGSSGSGKTLLGLHAVTTHLLTHPESHAAWVDTVGGFSARWLKEVVEGRITEARMQAEDEDGERVVLGESEVVKMVGEVLDRVWVMRVFDWWGVVEAVGEVMGHVEGQAAAVEGSEAVFSGDAGDHCGNGDVVEDSPREIGKMGGNMMVSGGGQQLKDQVVESSPLSSPLTSPLSSPLPSCQVGPPSPPLCPQKSSLHSPSQVPLVGGVIEIPDSDAESDEEIIVSGSRHHSPLHDLPAHSQNSQHPYEIPGSSDEDGDDTLPGSPLRPTEDIPITQVPSSPPTISVSSPRAIAAAAEPPGTPESAIGILVIDTITHPIEAMVNKAALSSGYQGGSGGTVPAGVASAYASLEKYFRELGGWAKQWGVGVLLLNNTLRLQPPHEPAAPALGPMFQHMLDMSVILQNNTNRTRRGWRTSDGSGSIENIGFEVLHDRGGGWSGRKGVVGVKERW
ncbi:hypothetical protein BGX38DRAFT_1271401 [Terfezia claveryi]|nr:hypothetical protein BGX38DRAFT_1271401 [Terfezia claveryi]